MCSARKQQDHLKEGGVATAVHMTPVTRNAEHRPIDVAALELGWNWHTVLITGDGVAHEDLRAQPVQDEDKAVAAPEQPAP